MGLRIIFIVLTGKDMNKISTFGSLLIFIGWFHSVAQVIIELHPVQDAVIGFHDNFNSANTNYGTADYYGAFSQPGAQGGENAAHALMKFDLSDIPPGATINSATLDIYGRGATSNTGDATSVGNVGDNQCYLERITQTWNADEVDISHLSDQVFSLQADQRFSLQTDQLIWLEFDQAC